MTAEKIQIQPRTLLVVCPNWVGDAVMATPTFDCIRQSFAESRVIGLIRRYARGVVEDGPWFDDLIEINDKSTGGFFRLVHQLRRLKPDMGVLLPNSFRSAIMLRLGGVKKIYGYRRNGRSILINGGPRPWRENRQFTPRPMAEYYMEICRWLNLAVPAQNKPRLFISDSMRTKGRRLIERYGITPGEMLIGLNPGAKFGSSKCWPAAHFARLAELLVQRWNCKIMLLIGPGEAEIGKKIVALSRAEIINTGPDNVDLALLKPLVRRCRLLITNDTGPRHYAVAFEVPVVVIMGPTDPRYTNANLEKTIVLRNELTCSPCHHKVCAEDQSCMTEISPQAVLQAGERLLQEHP